MTDPSLSLEALICWLEEQQESSARALKFARELKNRIGELEEAFREARAGRWKRAEELARIP